MKDRIGNIQQFVDMLRDGKWFRNCLNCEHWRDKQEICGMWNQRPPAKVIVYGCDQHSDEIPF